MTRTDTPGYLSSRLAEANPLALSEVHRRHLRTNIEPLLPADRDCAVLEIGFGLGGFLDYLKERGHRRYEGVEVDRECHAAVAGRHPVELCEDTVGFLEERLGRYAVVALFSVVSHLDREEAVQVLTAARRAMLPDGLVVVETFNASLPTSFYTFANDMTHRVPYTE